MNVVNVLLDRTFDVLLGPLRPLPLAASLSVVSLVTAVVLLLVFRLTSNQEALRAVKRQMHADLFEMRLFNDDLGALLRAELGVLRHSTTYLRLSLVALLWAFVPLALAVAQFQFHFGYAGVAVGRPVLLTAQVKPLDRARPGRAAAPTGVDRQPALLEVPPGVRVDSPAIWFPALRQVIWRVVAEKPGDYAVRLWIEGETYEKTLHASDGLARRSPVRTERGLLKEALYPSEPPLPDSAPFVFISVAYPERQIDVLGWHVPWMGMYLVESMIFALLLKTPLGVTF